MTNKELIKRFNIGVQYVIVNDLNKRPIKMIALGGNEVISESEADNDSLVELIGSFGQTEYQIVCEENQPLFYKYTDTDFSFDKLRELNKYRGIKSLSKEEALKIKRNIKSKQELEDNIVYVTDKQPVTNSLALAKQFGLEHRDVIKKIFELGSLYPSFLMKIKYDVCLHVNKVGGRPKTETVGDKKVVEFSTTIKTQETYDTFIHIPEDVYYQFVKKIGTPMNVNSKDLRKRREGMTRLTHIEAKQDEYFNAFQKVREYLHEVGVQSNEIDAIIKTRTIATLDLMANIHSYVERMNQVEVNKHLNVVNVSRIIFNIVNYINNINAINYIPPTDAELKATGRTRKTKSEHLQAELFITETALSRMLSLAAIHGLPLIDVLKTGFVKTEEEIHYILKEYNALGLLIP